MNKNEDSKPPLLTLSMVCYADILGFRKMIESAFDSGEEEDFLRRVKRSLNAAYTEVHKKATHGDSGKSFLDVPDLDVKLFTDNIVVYYPLRDPQGDLGEPEFCDILSLFGHAQARLAKDGFLLRGGITVGLHYQDDDIAYGNALLEAVDLDKSGGSPRLVIGSSVEPLVSKYLSWYHYDEGWTPHHQQLLEDEQNELLFVNYLGTAFDHFPDGPIDHELLAAHSEMVLGGLKKYKSVPSVRSKYEWTATYHNYVCCTFAEQFLAQVYEGPDPYYIAVGVEAQRVLDYIVPFEAISEVHPPRQLDAQRLRQRLSADSPLISV